jgi:hypothetical protein
MVTIKKISKQEASWPSEVLITKRGHMKVKSCQIHCSLSQSLKNYARDNVHLNNLMWGGK